MQLVYVQPKIVKDNRRIVLNTETNEEYYFVEHRLGATASESDPNERRAESIFGEVYKIRLPKDRIKDKKKDNYYLAAKIIPMSNDDFKNKHDASNSIVWRELYINRFISSNLLDTKRSQNFSIYYDYFICRDASVSDYSNRNLVSSATVGLIAKTIENNYNAIMRVYRENVKKIREKEHKDMLARIINKFNNLEYDIKNLSRQNDIPNYQYNLLMLNELEDAGMDNVLDAHINMNMLRRYLMRNSSSQCKLEIDKLKELSHERKLFPVYLSTYFVYSMLFQIFHAINSFNSIGIVHFDLHTGNVLAELCKDNTNPPQKLDYWRYKIGAKNYLVPNFGYIYKIIDFGQCQYHDSFKRMTREGRYRISKFILSRLENWAFSKREKRALIHINDDVHEVIATAPILYLYAHLKIFDLMIFLNAFISEIDNIYKDNVKDLKASNANARKILNDPQNADKLLKALNPVYTSVLSNTYTDLFNTFVNVFSRKLRPIEQTTEYMDLLKNITFLFEEKNIQIDEDDLIINEVPYK